MGFSLPPQSPCAATASTYPCLPRPPTSQPSTHLFPAQLQGRSAPGRVAKAAAPQLAAHRSHAATHHLDRAPADGAASLPTYLVFATLADSSSFPTQSTRRQGSDSTSLYRSTTPPRNITMRLLACVALVATGAGAGAGKCVDGTCSCKDVDAGGYLDTGTLADIGPSAFRGCASLTSLNAPNVTVISPNAFRACTSLASVELPHATSVGERAFGGCTSLTSIELSVATSIGERAFDGCTSLTSIDMPHVTAASIGDKAFDGCTSLSTGRLELEL